MSGVEIRHGHGFRNAHFILVLFILLVIILGVVVVC